MGMRIGACPPWAVARASLAAQTICQIFVHLCAIDIHHEEAYLLLASTWSKYSKRLYNASGGASMALCPAIFATLRCIDDPAASHGRLRHRWQATGGAATIIEERRVRIEANVAKLPST